MPEELSVRNMFDRLASECDDLKLRIIPAYQQIQRMTLRYAAASGGERRELSKVLVEPSVLLAECAMSTAK